MGEPMVQLDARDATDATKASIGPISTAQLVPTAHPSAWRSWILPVIVPLLLVSVILEADVLEGPKTAYVGVLAVIPMLAAVFGTARQTAAVGAVAWLAALGFGFMASDGNVTAQRVRLVIIALSATGAVFAARHREKRERQLADAERERAVMEQMRYDATTDMLTGALNRRGTLAALESIDTSALSTTPWTVVIGDCDNFKLVNDKHGHAVGDCYLKTVALRLTRAVSEGDVVGRWGGDEFLIALPLELEQATQVLQRVHLQTTREPVAGCEQIVPVSITFGAAQWLPGESLDDVVLRADQAMYRGKADRKPVTKAA